MGLGAGTVGWMRSAVGDGLSSGPVSQSFSSTGRSSSFARSPTALGPLGFVLPPALLLGAPSFFRNAIPVTCALLICGSARPFDLPFSAPVTLRPVWGMKSDGGESGWGEDVKIGGSTTGGDWKLAVEGDE